MRAFYLLSLAVCLLSASCYGQSSTIDRPHSLVFEYAFLSSLQPLTLEQIQQISNDQWQVTEHLGNYSFREEEYWIRIQASNFSSEPVKRIIRFERPLHDYVDVYQLHKNQLINKWQLGDMVVGAKLPVEDPHVAFPLELSAKQSVVTYIRLRSLNSIVLNLQNMSEHQHQVYLNKATLLAGIMYGILLVMGLYNLGLAIFTADKAYIAYVGYVFGLIFLFLGQTGHGYYYLWPNSPHFNAHVIPLAAGLFILPTLFFPYILLNVKQHLPKMRWFFFSSALAVAVFLILLPSLHLHTAFRFINGMSLLLSISVLIMAIYLAFQRVTFAFIYSLAWLVPLMGFAILSLSALGIIPSNFFTQNAGFIGGTTETIILSMLLAQRIKMEREEKLKAKEATIKAERVAMRSRLQYQGVFERAPVGIFSMNNNGSLTAANPAVVKMLEFESDAEALDKGSDIRSMFSNHKELSKAVQTQGAVVDKETTVTTRNGNIRTCSITLISKKADGPLSVDGFLTDISERKQAQRIQEIMEKERMSSIEQLVTGVAHEVNTPLGVNVTSLSCIRDGLHNVDQKMKQGSLSKDDFTGFINESEEAMTLMESNLTRISDLVKRFKLVSVQHLNTQKESLNLKAFTEGILKVHVSSHPDLLVSVDAQDCDNITTYPAALNIILNQLIENSLVHGFQNQNLGEIKIAFRQISSNHIELLYEDNGSGVAEAIRDKIFDPFITTLRGKSEHAGLGLYRVYNLVRQVLKGDVEILDSSGFKMRLTFHFE